MGLPAFQMTTALSFEEARALSQAEHDLWFEQFRPLFESEQRPTVTGLSRMILASRQQFLGACMKTVIEQSCCEQLRQMYAPCPHCGRKLTRKRLAEKEVSTLAGEFSLQRPYFHCPDCQYGFHPLDEVIELVRDHHQIDVQTKAVRMAAEMPFDLSAELFADLTGINVGEHYQHDTLTAVGEAATLECVIPDREEIVRRIEQAALTSNQLPILVVAADGAHMPTRPRSKRKGKRGAGRYQEAKGFRIYLVAGKGRIIQVASWHQIQDADQFRKDLAIVAARIPQEKVRVSLLGDGAEWLWPSMTACFPTGRPILDFFHCAEHIHDVAKAQYGDGELLARQWAEAALTLLSWSAMDDVLDNLREISPVTTEAKEKIHKLVGYLDKNRERIHYESDRAEGFPIGSGGIESANKFICHTRLKRSGAWWVKELGNNMLRVRCALVNGTYEKVFECYAGQSRQPIEQRIVRS